MISLFIKAKRKLLYIIKIVNICIRMLNIEYGVTFYFYLRHILIKVFHLKALQLQNIRLNLYRNCNANYTTKQKDKRDKNKKFE